LYLLFVSSVFLTRFVSAAFGNTAPSVAVLLDAAEAEVKQLKNKFVEISSVPWF
jgi:hypothetical protein